MAHETFVWHLPISLGDNNKQRWKATMDLTVHWGANPGKLDLPAADSRGNSSEYLRAGSNIPRRRTADDYLITCNLQSTLRASLVCCFCVFFLICSNLFCIFVDSFFTRTTVKQYSLNVFLSGQAFWPSRTWWDSLAFCLELCCWSLSMPQF